MKEKENKLIKGTIYIEKERVKEFSKWSVLSRLKWLEEANKFIMAIHGPIKINKSKS